MRGATPASVALPTPEFVREFGGIQEFRLPNGLQVLLYPDQTQSTATVNITYRVGSRHERTGERGMAHLLEHLLFKGTHKQGDIAGAMAQRGVRFNGTTTADRTNYFASFNADPETLAFLIELEADRMVNSRVSKSDLDTEMTVVRNELEIAETDPLKVLTTKVSSAAYTVHPYGHSPLGLRQDIETMPIEALQDFYKRYYRPDNATLLLAGKFDLSAALALVGRHFGPLAQPKAPLPKTQWVEPPQDGERSITVRGAGPGMLMAAYHVPAAAHPDTAALTVHSMLMGLPGSGLLHKRLVEPKLAGGVGLVPGGSVDSGLDRAFVLIHPGADPAKAEAAMLEALESRKSGLFDEADLTRVRDMLVINYRRALKSPEGLIQLISETVAAGDWRLLFLLLDELPKVTLADVERVRAAYFRPANRTLGRTQSVTPAERVVEIPMAPSLVDRLSALKPPTQLEEGESLSPEPEALEARMSRVTLPSGIQLHVLNKQTRGKEVLLQMQMRWGDKASTRERLGSDFVARLMPEGTSTMGKQAVQDAMVKLRAGLTANSWDQGVTVNLSAERDTLLPALALAAQLIQDPLLPQEAFDRQRALTIGGLQGARDQLPVLLEAAVREHHNQSRGLAFGHPDYRPSLDDRIHAEQKTTLDDVRAFHRDFWSANDMRVSVVGPVPEGLAAEVERLFGHWKKPQAPAYVRHLTPYQPVPAARFDAVSPSNKPTAIVELQQSMDINLQSADYAALDLAVRIFGGGGLETRLATRVRGQEGLGYSVHAGLAVDFHDNAGSFAIRGTCAPAQRERMLDVLHDEVRRMYEFGVTESELARAITAVLEARKAQRSDHGALVNFVDVLSERKQTWATARARDEAYAAVTVEHANAAWRKYIRPDGFVTATAGVAH